MPAISTTVGVQTATVGSDRDLGGVLWLFGRFIGRAPALTEERRSKTMRVRVATGLDVVASFDGIASNPPVAAWLHVFGAPNGSRDRRCGTAHGPRPGLAFAL